MIKAESGKEGKEPCPGLALKKDKGKRIRDKVEPIARDPWSPPLKLPPTLKFLAVYAISRRLFKHEITGGRTERIGRCPSRERGTFTF
jgi:hypothetical protein